MSSANDSAGSLSEDSTASIQTLGEARATFNETRALVYNHASRPWTMRAALLGRIAANTGKVHDAYALIAEKGVPAACAVASAFEPSIAGEAAGAESAAMAIPSDSLSEKCATWLADGLVRSATAISPTPSSRQRN